MWYFVVAYFSFAQAPAVHGSLKLADRCELALTGFLLQDLWSLMARKRERQQSVAKGMFQMAGQTRTNMQAIALTVACVCLTKDATWCPWQRDQVLSEIHIERFFGRLRASSPSGDLTARSFWKAAAALARQNVARLKKEAAVDAVEEPLSEDEFLF